MPKAQKYVVQHNRWPAEQVELFLKVKPLCLRLEISDNARSRLIIVGFLLELGDAAHTFEFPDDDVEDEYWRHDEPKRLPMVEVEGLDWTGRWIEITKLVQLDYLEFAKTHFYPNCDCDTANRANARLDPRIRSSMLDTNSTAVTKEVTTAKSLGRELFSIDDLRLM